MFESVQKTALSFRKRMFEPVDPSSLAAFRIVFGGIMLLETFRYWSKIHWLYLDAPYQFTYEYFSFVIEWPGNGMYIHFVVMGICAAAVMLGFYYRFFATLYALCFLYFFLLEQSIYLNHFYLVCLLSFLMIFLQADSWASIHQVWDRNREPQQIPYWNVFLIRWQLVIVYFFGGIAKVNYDWLRGEPLCYWLEGRAHYPVVGKYFVMDWVALYIFAYGGLIFDLTIGFLLLCRKTRSIALVPLLTFHLFNAWVFSIGIFPWLMIAATIIFFDFDLPRKTWAKITRKGLKPLPSFLPSSLSQMNLASSFVVIWLAIQCLLPLRHHLSPGNVGWTEEGHRFSWRMKLRNKRGFCMFALRDREDGYIWRVYPQDELNPVQVTKMSTTPHMVVQYAKRIESLAIDRGMKDPGVFAVCFSSLNGRPYQFLIDPSVDLTEESCSPFRSETWIVPLKPDQPIGNYDALTEETINAIILADGPPYLKELATNTDKSRFKRWTIR